MDALLKMSDNGEDDIFYKGLTPVIITKVEEQFEGFLLSLKGTRLPSNVNN
jgi:hypothetical protein